jgi:hypothetical protein
VINAAFALVLLILVLVSSIYAFVSKNPDIRYQPMRDDRGSFIKGPGQSLPSTELDALGVTARGDMKSRDLDDDNDSFINSSTQPRSPYEASQVPLPPSTASSARTPDMPHSPVDPTVPFFPSSGGDRPRTPYGQTNQSAGMPLLTASGVPRTPSRGESRTPSRGESRTPSRGESRSPALSQRSYNNSPHTPPSRGRDPNPFSNQWQIGAGYDH